MGTEALPVSEDFCRVVAGESYRCPGMVRYRMQLESGQDGSKRFKVAGDNPGAVADMVRTCDIEAAMAHAMSVMADFSKVAGRPLEEQRRWEEMAKEGQKRARSMFVDGWYRDFDARNDPPIIIENYFDV